jgi:hypothetical protein
MFLIFSLMCLPIFSIYTKGTAYEDGVAPPVYEQYSLGNIGYSSQVCTSAPLDIGKITV